MNENEKLNAILHELRVRQFSDFVDYMQGLSETVIENRLQLCFYTRGKLETWELFALALSDFDRDKLDRIEKDAIKQRDYNGYDIEDLKPYYFLTANEYDRMLACFE
jgi:hypothetical protein